MAKPPKAEKATFHREYTGSGSRSKGAKFKAAKEAEKSGKVQPATAAVVSGFPAFGGQSKKEEKASSSRKAAVSFAPSELKFRNPFANMRNPFAELR